ncbi:hypothetical protein EEB13_05440 [Rhodococcus sp. WS3]|uniref:crossover junction endodeoxyribonuclease RuvC n=1 Tax=Rhodococcus sp. WS3 TaxID=2486271 RepID=UPI00114390DC|nr:crossover junction endodeoxyribonuclease RuvC [Rhodococcus sp. WS3]ROZ49369.1 hypothetical protein EEB13_05440 [Rhodococcus sp. WS3]
MSTIVGLDPSLTAAGIAILRSPDTAHTPNAPKLASVGATGSKTDTLAQRSIRVGKQFERIIRSMPASVQLVVIEELPFVPPKNASLFQERCALFHRVVELLALRRVPVVAASVTTVKFFATGNGRADKLEVMAAMRELWPHAPIRDDNQSDALALATMGAMHLGWHEPELPHHYAPKVDWTGVLK